MTELSNIIHNKWIYYYRTNIVIKNLYDTLINEKDFFESEELRQRWIANKKAEIMLITDEKKFKTLISKSSNNCWIEISEHLNNYEKNQVKILDNKSFVNINLPIKSDNKEYSVVCHPYCIHNIIIPVIEETKTLLNSNKKINDKVLSQFYNILTKYNYNVWKLNNEKYITYEHLDDFEKLQVKKMINIIKPRRCKSGLDLTILESYPVIPQEELTCKNFIMSILFVLVVIIIPIIFNK